MTFKINGVEPTAINVDGIDVNVVSVISNGSATLVWGKPFALSISTDSNVSVVVERTVSVNQHAATGNLSNGSLVYYGDVLKISVSASSGYNVDTFTVNGSAFTSGELHSVTSAVNVVATSVVSVSWKTVWTGSKGYFSTSGGSAFSPTNTTTTHNLDVITLSNYPNVQRMQLIGVGQMKHKDGEAIVETNFDVTVNVGDSNVTLVVTDAGFQTLTATQYVSFPNKTSCTITTNSGKMTLATLTSGVVLKTINLYY